jgi:hypothetical protein
VLVRYLNIGRGIRSIPAAPPMFIPSIARFISIIVMFG